MFNYFNYQLKYHTLVWIKRIKKKPFSPRLTHNMMCFGRIYNHPHGLKIIDIQSMERWMIYMDIK